MKVVFFGSSKYSVIAANALHENIKLCCVVTKSTSDAVKAFVSKKHIPLVIADKIDSHIIKQIATYSPDFLVVADYGLIVPNDLLKLPKYAPLNIHHSLLPKYRGPTPAPSAILNGEKYSGVSIIIMIGKIDAGDILAQEKYKLKSEETTDSLLTQLNALGGKLIVAVLNNFDKYYAKRRKQNEQNTTPTPRLTKENGHIDILKIKNSIEIKNLKLKIKAYSPWPGVWFKTKLNGKEKVIKLLPDQKIQVEGKMPMSYRDFLNGYPEAKETMRVLQPDLTRGLKYD